MNNYKDLNKHLLKQVIGGHTYHNKFWEFTKDYFNDLAIRS